MNIEILTLSEVEGVQGEAGDFEVTIRTLPRYVDTTKCIACGTCAEKCPKKVPDEFNESLSTRRAAYVKYAQAVPLRYAIDAAHCIYLQKGKCRACEKFCPAEAVDFGQKEQRRVIHAGALVLAPGFKAFDPSGLETTLYGSHPNVVTSMEFERILSATGPYQGNLKRPSDLREPRSIAWLQCIGSRGFRPGDHGYCSSVCCMYAVKEAVIAKEHARGNPDCGIFFMDMRTHGKDFERYRDDAEKKHGVRFIRSRVHSLHRVPGSEDVAVRYASEEGQLKEEIFQMVVLSVGIEIPPDMAGLAEILGVEISESRFCRTGTFEPVKTSRPGIYVCGAFQGPKDIPQSVIEAGAAASAATELLASARHTQTRIVHPPLERDVDRMYPMIGVFLCHCGINIGGVVRIPEVADYARSLPGVVHVEQNLFTCSQDTQDTLKKVIHERGLNRVVIAACTPRTHEGLFQETLVGAGLNKYLLEMANIRNHDSWVHAADPDSATQKAKDLVRMAVAKAALMMPLRESEVPVTPRALVVGGGISGMVASRSLSTQGYQVCLVEQASLLGGQARRLDRTWKGEDVQKALDELIQSVESDPAIKTYLDTELTGLEGFVGNFRATLRTGDREEVVEHGVAIIATGAQEHIPHEYLYGEDPRVMTHLDLDWRLSHDPSSLRETGTAVFIQCVGSREPARPYCSRVCCTHSMQSALHLKELNPEMDVFILYRDIRTYGEREYLYREARTRGIVFVRFSLDNKPRVTATQEGLAIEVFDPVLRRPLIIKADLLTLATAIVPYRDERLARLFKVPMNEDGFFVEAHAKLAPCDFASEGVFLCGMAHYPKPIDESVAQAQAAASRASTLLSRATIRVGGVVSQIRDDLCSGCMGCVHVCPYGAIAFNEAKKVAEVNEALCKGCGACAATCPSEAITLCGFDNRQLYAQIRSALS